MTRFLLTALLVCWAASAYASPVTYALYGEISISYQSPTGPHGADLDYWGVNIGNPFQAFLTFDQDLWVYDVNSNLYSDPASALTLRLGDILFEWGGGLPFLVFDEAEGAWTDRFGTLLLRETVQNAGKIYAINDVTLTFDDPTGAGIDSGRIGDLTLFSAGIFGQIHMQDTPDVEGVYSSNVVNVHGEATRIERVPEPSSLALLAVALVILGGHVRLGRAKATRTLRNAF